MVDMVGGLFRRACSNLGKLPSFCLFFTGFYCNLISIIIRFSLFPNFLFSNSWLQIGIDKILGDLNIF